MKAWNKRWFVFDRNKRTLVYYADKNEVRFETKTLTVQCRDQKWKKDLWVDHKLKKCVYVGKISI